MKFLAFKTCANCIGRSWKQERRLHLWTAMFTTENFRRPSLHEAISPLCLEKTRDARLLRYVYACRINSFLKPTLSQFLVKTSILILFGRLGKGEPEHLCMRWRNVWTWEKKAVPPDEALERRTKRVTPGFRPVRSLLDAVGPSLLPATEFASRYGIEGDMSAPKPYETNPTPTHIAITCLSHKGKIIEGNINVHTFIRLEFNSINRCWQQK